VRCCVEGVVVARLYHFQGNGSRRQAGLLGWGGSLGTTQPVAHVVQGSCSWSDGCAHVLPNPASRQHPLLVRLLPLLVPCEWCLVEIAQLRRRASRCGRQVKKGCQLTAQQSRPAAVVMGPVVHQTFAPAVSGAWCVTTEVPYTSGETHPLAVGWGCAQLNWQPLARSPRV
jgi:hypothetical protein